jgi:RNA polymerase sigma-70 factor (ECF subfamily)
MRVPIDSTVAPAADTDATSRVATFEHHRGRLFGIAYRMLGSVDDANDLVQETYLRWHRADAAEIRAPEAWLVAVTTRLSIDRLRRSEIEREHYPGDWLPEPLATAPHAADRRAELASDLSMAFLVLLERLAPEERAAFLLREVFDADYSEIARVLGRSDAACRQMVHRARERVRTKRTRFPVANETRERLVERFLQAIRTEDRDSLLALVAPDATWTSDGGGIVRAATRTIEGGERIVRLVLGVERKWGSQLRHEIAWINGEPAIVTMAGDQLFATMSFDTDGERLTGFYRVLNPEKLKSVSKNRWVVGGGG